MTRDPYEDGRKAEKLTGATPSLRGWAAELGDPRIVRVSRSLGGKDRHSKVTTVRGLRDRRVRLSVPTAVQLYDLQERLGLSQPSKVVDWLLDAARHEIDKLPPLPFPPGGFFPICPPPPTTAPWHPAESSDLRDPRLGFCQVVEGEELHGFRPPPPMSSSYVGAAAQINNFLMGVSEEHLQSSALHGE